MKKIILLFISIILLTGCGSVDKDSLIKDFVNSVNESESYTTEGHMEIYNAEDTFKYDVKVSYKDDDYFKVEMLNTINSHEQIILKDKEAVYVITPSLNKSYKFVSEWPYNSSQAYILNSLVKDIEADDNLEFIEEDDNYILKVSVSYPNNSYLKYEKIIFDKNKNLKSVIVYDQDDIESIKVNFDKIDLKAHLNEKDFDIEELVNGNCCQSNNLEEETKQKEEQEESNEEENTKPNDNENKDSNTQNNNSNTENNANNANNNNNNNNNKTKTTDSLNDIIYPLYVPSNTYLKGKELISTENGERAILTFNGAKNFVLIEETSSVFEEFETIPVFGDPLMLSNTIGAITDNSLVWSSNNVDYYLTSKDLTVEEIKLIADSLTTATVYQEK